MNEAEFRDRVAQTGPIDDPEPIAEATLETLGEALSSGQADDIAEYLPDEYAESLREGGERTTDETASGSGADSAASLDREEFLERVWEREREYAAGNIEDKPETEIDTRVSAVTDALAETVPREERRGLRSQIPDDVESLFTDGDGAR